MALGQRLLHRVPPIVTDASGILNENNVNGEFQIKILEFEVFILCNLVEKGWNFFDKTRFENASSFKAAIKVSSVAYVPLSFWPQENDSGTTARNLQGFHP